MILIDDVNWPEPPIGLVFGATEIDPPEFVAGPFDSPEAASAYLNAFYEKDFMAPGWQPAGFRSP